MAFVHPVIGALTIVFCWWVLTRGLTARTRGRGAAAARSMHRRWAPYGLAAMVVSGVTGIASTLLLRPDLTLGETWHLEVGWTAIAVMATAGLLSRAFARYPALRQVHPWFGVASAMLALFQGLLGIGLLP